MIKFFRKHTILLTTLAGIITAIVLFLTLIPAEELGHSRIWEYDKPGHMLMFGTWTFFFGLLRYIKKHPTLPNFSFEFIVASMFGLSIEILQYILPIHRTADLFDFTADVIGIIIAVALLKLISRNSYKEEAIAN